MLLFMFINCNLKIIRLVFSNNADNQIFTFFQNNILRSMILFVYFYTSIFITKNGTMQNVYIIYPLTIDMQKWYLTIFISNRPWLMDDNTRVHSLYLVLFEFDYKKKNLFAIIFSQKGRTNDLFKRLSTNRFYGLEPCNHNDNDLNVCVHGIFHLTCFFSSLTGERIPRPLKIPPEKTRTLL